MKLTDTDYNILAQEFYDHAGLITRMTDKPRIVKGLRAVMAMLEDHEDWGNSSWTNSKQELTPEVRIEKLKEYLKACEADLESAQEDFDEVKRQLEGQRRRLSAVSYETEEIRALIAELES